MEERNTVTCEISFRFTIAASGSIHLMMAVSFEENAPFQTDESVVCLTTEKGNIYIAPALSETAQSYQTLEFSNEMNQS
jgi:hypothetical protein